MIPEQGWNLEDWFQSPALQGTPTRIQHEFPTEGGRWEGVFGDRGTSRMGPRGS